MRRAKGCWICLLGAALLAFAGCTNNSLDDAGGPNVVLEITQLDFSEGVEGELTTGTCSVSGNACLSTADCPNTEFCDLPLTGQGCEIPEWSLTFANVPKTDLAVTSPFNDIVLEQITFTYSNWPPGTLSASTPLGLVVPAQGTATLQFGPISQGFLEVLSALVDPAEPTTVQVNLLFEGTVLDSDPISITAGGSLSIDPCY